MSTGLQSINADKKIKLLYILNIAKKVNDFSHSAMLAAQEMGIDFHIAGNWSYASDEERKADEEKYGIKIYQIDFIRTPYHLGNIKAYNQLKEIVRRERFDVIHCNTPIGGVLGRLVGAKYKTPIVIYQAHGFHFYKGAPRLNWLIYYPIEKTLAHYTDALITINREDFEFAKKKFHIKNQGLIYYVPGVGIDLTKIKSLYIDRNTVRSTLGLSEDDIVLISAGRLDVNKNNETIIRAVARVSNIKMLLCGEGDQRDHLKDLAKKLGVSDRILFLGNRIDIMELYQAADIFVLMSFREGLSRSIMEAMASGLPCIVSKIRGNVDLIEDGINGYLVDTLDFKLLSERIQYLCDNKATCDQMSKMNRIKIQQFSLSSIIPQMINIYKMTFN